jgi:hypothetical protein
MKTTFHARERMRQRCIRPGLVHLALEEGVPLQRNPARVLLTRQHLRSLWAEGLLGRDEYQRASKAVPIVCVVEDEHLVTVFRPRTSTNRARSKARVRRVAPGVGMNLEESGEAE